MAALCLGAALVGGGCGKQGEVIVESSAGKDTAPDAIDRDPLALLPASAIGYFELDMRALMQSAFGERLREIVARRAPFPPSYGFEVDRDLEALYVGSYSMQGLDMVGVAVGAFNAEKLEKAAGAEEATPLGPLVRSTYAGRTLYTSGDVGFSVLTPRTLLFGNETGIRRALDRIKEGRVARALEPWAVEILETKNAAFAGGADFRAGPLAEGLRTRFRFLEGLKMLRGVGNFRPPGINLAGTASYESAERAATGAEGLKELHSTAQQFAWVLRTFLGTDQPLRRIEATASGTEVPFVVEVDGDAVTNLLLRVLDFMGGPGAPAQSSAAAGS